MRCARMVATSARRIATRKGWGWTSSPQSYEASSRSCRSRRLYRSMREPAARTGSSTPSRSSAARPLGWSRVAAPPLRRSGRRSTTHATRPCSARWQASAKPAKPAPTIAASRRSCPCMLPRRPYAPPHGDSQPRTCTTRRLKGVGGPGSLLTPHGRFALEASDSRPSVQLPAPDETRNRSALQGSLWTAYSRFRIRGRCWPNTRLFASRERDTPADNRSALLWTTRRSGAPSRRCLLDGKRSARRGNRALLNSSRGAPRRSSISPPGLSR